MWPGRSTRWLAEIAGRHNLSGIALVATFAPTSSPSLDLPEPAVPGARFSCFVWRDLDHPEELQCQLREFLEGLPSVASR